MDSIERIAFSTGAATGGAGNATATGYSPRIAGAILAVAVQYLDSPPATSDITLSDEEDPTADAFLSLANATTDRKFYPRKQAAQNTGSAISGVYDAFLVVGRIKAVLAQANDGDSVLVTVWYRRT